MSLYTIAEHEEGLIDQALMRAKIDLKKIPPGRLDEVLSQLGINPRKIPETLKRKFNVDIPVPTTARAASEDVGDLMKDAAAPPPAATPEDEGEDPDAYHLDEQGDIVPDLPQDEWEISAILVKVRGGSGYNANMLLYNFKVIDDRATAVSPASVMREFFDTFLKGSANVLLSISVLVTVVAGASITTSIYNAVSARLREIAILSCCFGRPPAIQHTVLVTCPAGMAVSYYSDQINVSGVLSVANARKTVSSRASSPSRRRASGRHAERPGTWPVRLSRKAIRSCLRRSTRHQAVAGGTVPPVGKPAHHPVRRGLRADPWRPAVPLLRRETELRGEASGRRLFGRFKGNEHVPFRSGQRANRRRPEALARSRGANGARSRPAATARPASDKGSTSSTASPSAASAGRLRSSTSSRSRCRPTRPRT